MTVLVKKGGRQDFTCAGCGQVIEAKVPHLRAGGPPYKRYHQGCETKVDVKAKVETSQTEVTETENQAEESEESTEEEDEESEEIIEESTENEEPTLANLLRPRGRNGQFLPRT